MDIECFRGFPYRQTELPIHKQSNYVVLQMETNLLHERTIKVAVIGHSTCGKRAFVHRLINKPYLRITSPMVSFEFESIHEVRGNESILWMFMIFPGNELCMKNCLESLRDVEAVIVCRDIKSEDEDDEIFFRQMKETIRTYTTHASIFAVYTKNDRQSMEYEPYPPNLMKGIQYLGMTSAKMNRGFEGILTNVYDNLPYIPYRISIEEDASESRCCCFM